MAISDLGKHVLISFQFLTASTKILLIHRERIGADVNVSQQRNQHLKYQNHEILFPQTFLELVLVHLQCVSCEFLSCK